MKTTNRKSNNGRHIALYLAGLRKGGAERVMCVLADGLYERGWKVTLVTTFFTPPEFLPVHAAWDPHTGADDPEKEGIHRVYSEPEAGALTKSRFRNFLIRCGTLRKIWKDTSPDVILSFISMNNVMAILTSLGLKIPVVISVRGTPSVEYNTAKLRMAANLTFPFAAGAVLQTEQARDYFPAGVRKKSVILPNPLNPDFIRPICEGNRKKRIISTGRLDENKDQALLLKAFARALDSIPEGKDPAEERWTVHLYGDGPERQKLETLARDLGIEEQVVFEGVVSDMAERICDASIFVLSSRTEGMPNALIESMALGLGCIATDCPCGGPAELIRDGENGYLVPVGDVEMLSGKLAALMNDPALIRTLGTKAAAVQTMFCREEVVSRWEQYLLSCTHGKRTAYDS